MSTTQHKPNNDSEWVSAARKDPAAFEHLYNRYYKDLFRFVYRRLNSKDEAADVTQQVFLKALVKLDSYRDKGLPFMAWMFRIAVNEMNMMFRKNKVQRTINLQSEELPPLLSETDTQVQDDELLYKALNQLDADELWLVEMRYFEQRPFAEIAQIIDIPEATCKTRMYRVLEKLRNIFKNY
ncbi:MAG: RNA polymerase sigma factor [Bacteroidota bacterium]|nr:RNA polymerase sigma factor [Bacteroidota bacterium]